MIFQYISEVVNDFKWQRQIPWQMTCLDVLKTQQDMKKVYVVCQIDQIAARHKLGN